jgi:8-oxo-dGTP pyrophosphatase MutT (NUDIX family)
MDVSRIERLVSTFEEGRDGAGQKSKELILGLLAHTPEPLSRMQFTPGHITCTGLILGPLSDRVLLVHHARLGRWLLPGGHVEAEDNSVIDSARREVIEETGAELHPSRQPLLVGLDVHGIPPKRKEPFHLHHDLVFGFHALSDTAVCSPESRDVVWCTPAEFDSYDVPANVRIAFARSVMTSGEA